MILESTSFTSWIPHAYIFNTLLLITELFELTVPVICYSQSTLLIINNLWNLSLLGITTSVSAASPWGWSCLLPPRCLIRGMRSGTGYQGQIARWVAGDSAAFCSVKTKNIQTKQNFQLWLHTGTSFQVWIPWQNNSAVKLSTTVADPGPKHCPNPHLFIVPLTCTWLTAPSFSVSIPLTQEANRRPEWQLPFSEMNKWKS